jgi:hypothetical protein
MTAPAGCKLIGKWRITKADLWDKAYLDLVELAYLLIRADGRGEILFGALTASLDLEYAREMVFFNWSGSDEGDQITGSGSADLNSDGTLAIEFSFHNGDEAELQARKW